MTTDNQFNPFSIENMNEIFRIDPDNLNRVISRESGHLEFKENFNFAALPSYARTMAAFANNEGGYLVFGVKNRPRELLGMQNDQFDRLEPERFEAELARFFVPEIEWDLHPHFIDDRSFGIIYTHECRSKPVIAKITHDQGEDIREGEIYYRYRAKSKRIKYAELHQIIEDRQQFNMDRWLDFMRRAARIGVDNAAILDTLQGTISGPGGTLVVDEKLLDEIKFIREGEFREKEGEPTLRLVGNVVSVPSGVVQPVRLVDLHVGIHAPDIIRAFLSQETVRSPREFIKQICFANSGYLPVYYFMRLANLTIVQTIELLQNQQSRSQSKSKLLERLTNDTIRERENPSSTHPSGQLARQYYAELTDGNLKPDDVPVEDIRCALRAIRMLGCDEIDCTYLLPMLRYWFDQFYTTQDSNLDGDLRKSICYLDYKLNHPDEKCENDQST